MSNIFLELNKMTDRIKARVIAVLGITKTQFDLDIDDIHSGFKWKEC